MSTIEQGETRRRGRPLKPEADRRSATVKFRIRDDLRARLAEASEKSGRPVSDEVEIRLVNSFYLEPLHSLVYENGDSARRLAISLLEAIRSIQEAKDSAGRRVGSEDWSSSEGTKAAIRTAAKVILDHMAPLNPPPDANSPPNERSEETTQILRMVQLGRLLGLEKTGQALQIADDMVRQSDATQSITTEH